MVQPTVGKGYERPREQRVESVREGATAAVEPHVQVRIQVLEEFGVHQDRLNRLIKCSIDCVDVLDSARVLRSMLSGGLRQETLPTVLDGLEGLAIKVDRVVQQLEADDARHDEVAVLHTEIARAADAVAQLRRQSGARENAQVEQDAQRCLDEAISKLRRVGDAQLREAEKVLEALGGRIKEVMGGVLLGVQERRDSTVSKSGGLSEAPSARAQLHKNRGWFGLWSERKGVKSG